MTASRSNHRWLLVRSLLRSAASTATLITVYYLAPLDRSRDTAALAFLGLGLALFAALIIWQVRAILGAEHPRLRAVESLSVAVPMLLVIFAGTCILMERAHPGSFSESLNHTDALYFAVTVFATVGFGDITPVSGTARVFTSVQMIVDLVAVGGIARVVVGAVQTGLRHRPGPDQGPMP
jgi:hypothetical protein